MKGDTSFGVALREARQRAGMTQNKVSEVLGMNPVHISLIEGGKRIPFKYDRVIAVAEFLGVSPARMLCQWAGWRGSVPISRTGDDRRNLVAAALSYEWRVLSPEAIDRIGREVGL